MQQSISFAIARRVCWLSMQFEDDYELGKRLGSGAFADVYLCTKKGTTTERAVKRVDRSFLRYGNSLENQGAVEGSQVVMATQRRGRAQPVRRNPCDAPPKEPLRH